MQKEFPEPPQPTEEQVAGLQAELAATELLRKTLSGQSAEPLDLSDPVLTARIFRTVAEDLVHVFRSTCGEKADKLEDTQKICNAMIGLLAVLLTGGDARFTPKPGWHPAGLAARLRQIPAVISPEQARGSDNAVVTHAVFHLVRDTARGLVQMQRNGALTDEAAEHVVQYVATAGLALFTDACPPEEAQEILAQ